MSSPDATNSIRDPASSSRISEIQYLAPTNWPSHYSICYLQSLPSSLWLSRM